MRLPLPVGEAKIKIHQQIRDTSTVNSNETNVQKLTTNVNVPSTLVITKKITIIILITVTISMQSFKEGLFL